MNKMNRFTLVYCFLMLLVFVNYSCRTYPVYLAEEAEIVEEVSEDADDADRDILTGAAALPPLLIYKTRGDYRNQVPVTLNEEKTEIINFPAPQDLFYGGELAIPVSLEQGWLLDIRGIGVGVAFLSMTYEEYVSLDTIPTAKQLFEMILDNDPVNAMFVCGNRFGNEEDVIRAERIIRTDDFSDCIRLK